MFAGQQRLAGQEPGLDPQGGDRGFLGEHQHVFGALGLRARFDPGAPVVVVAPELRAAPARRDFQSGSVRLGSSEYTGLTMRSGPAARVSRVISASASMSAARKSGSGAPSFR